MGRLAGETQGKKHAVEGEDKSHDVISINLPGHIPFGIPQFLRNSILAMLSVSAVASFSPRPPPLLSFHCRRPVEVIARSLS